MIFHHLGRVSTPRTIGDGKGKGKNHVRFNTITKVVSRRSAGSTNNAGQTQVSQGQVENHQSLAVRCKQCLVIKHQTLAVRFSQWQEVAGEKKEGSANNTTSNSQKGHYSPTNMETDDDVKIMAVIHQGDKVSGRSSHKILRP